MKKYITAKRLIILSVVILSVFAIINVAWLFLRYIPYHRCREKMDVIDTYGLLSYGKVEDGYRYGVSTPAYLGWEGGYISVSLDQSYKIHLDEYGNEDGASGLSLGLYIWMKPFGENEYGVDILSPDIDKQIYITKDLEYVPYDPNDTKYNQQAEQILAEYKDQIQELMNRAQTMWPDVFN